MRTQLDVELYNAAKRGDIEAVKDLKNRGANVDAKNDAGETALHVATIRWDTEIVKFLIGASANVNAKNNKGQTPLHISAQSGCVKVAEALLNNGADFNAKDIFGKPPTDEAVGHIRRMIEKKTKETNAPGPQTSQSAPSFDHLKMVEDDQYCRKTIEELISNKNHHIVGPHGHNLLHYVAHQGQIDLMKKLLDEGLNRNLPANDGDTPLITAIKKIETSKEGQINRTEFVKLLLNHNSKTTLPYIKADVVNAFNLEGNTALHEVVNASIYRDGKVTSEDKLDMFRVLIQNNANPFMRNRGGQNAIDLAISCCETQFVKALLQKNDFTKNPENFSLTNHAGETLIDKVVKENKFDIFKELILSGAKINDSKEWKTLHYAVSNGNTQVIEYLLGKDKVVNESQFDIFEALTLNKAEIKYFSGSEIEAQKSIRANIYEFNDESKLKTIAYKTSKGTKFIEYLSAENENVNLPDNDGDTPLHIAVRAKKIGSIRVLLEANANVNSLNNRGNAPIHSASDIKDDNNTTREILKALIEKGANVNSTNEKDGITPLQIAVENCNTSTIKLLLENGANTDSFTAEPNKNKTLIEVIALNEDISEPKRKINFNELFKHGAEINTQLFEDQNISDDIKDYLRQLYTPKNIEERNKELHDKYVASILNGDPLPRCNDFIGGVIVEAIKSIKLDEIKDIPEIKKSDYYKLIELNKNIENSDEIIKAIIKYPKEFEKFVETSSKLKATSKGVTQGSQIDQAQTPQTQVLFDSDLMGIILKNSLSPNFKKALGASATKLTNYLMETEFSNFIKAISDNNLEKVKALANEKNINRTYDGKITPLEIAVLANEKNINRTLDGQISSLGIAVEKGNDEIVEFLLKKGAKISEESLRTLRKKYEKNDLITERLNLVEEKQKSRVSSEPSATTQIRAGSSTRGLVRNSSQEINYTIQ